MSRIRVLVGFEYSAIVRDAFRARGFDAWSCDILPTEGNPKWHIQDDINVALKEKWNLGIFHPPCTRLTNAGVRWLSVPPPNRTLEEIWLELYHGVTLYRQIREVKIKYKAIENPIMNPYAKWMTEAGERHVVQPWWFGDPAFKATGFELFNLPKLKPTNKLTPPKRGTREHKEWSKVHRMSPGPDRGKERSRMFPGIADAMAEQWGNYLLRI